MRSLHYAAVAALLASLAACTNSSSPKTLTACQLAPISQMRAITMDSNLTSAAPRAAKGTTCSFGDGITVDSVTFAYGVDLQPQGAPDIKSFTAFADEFTATGTKITWINLDQHPKWRTRGAKAAFARLGQNGLPWSNVIMTSNSAMVQVMGGNKPVVLDQLTDMVMSNFTE